MASTLELLHQTQLDLLAAPPLAIVTITGNQSVPSGFGALDVQWQQVNTDTYGFFSFGSPTKLTPTVAGYYLCLCIIDWQDVGGPGTGSRIVNLTQNGSANNGTAFTVAQITHSPMSDNAFITTQTLSGLGFFNGTTDFLEVFVFNGNASAVNIVPGRTLLVMFRVHV